MSGGYLTVGKVAGLAGVNLQTVLYYERRRLLSPARRTDSGYRLYAPDAVKTIRFIKKAQELGFTLEEVKRLLRLRVGRRAQCASVKRQAEARLDAVREKLSALKAMEKSLKQLIRICAANATTRSCPVLDSWEDGGSDEE